MKKLALPFVVLFVVLLSCTAQKTIPAADKNQALKGSDTVRIANDELQYEVIIIDPGFNSWLQSTARPRNHYTQQYMETRNRTWVAEWNNRAQNPRNANLFEMPINYESTVDYGYEVNYLLFNYLTYFQLKNNIRLGGFVARI